MNTTNKLVITLFLGIVFVAALFIWNQEDKGVIKHVTTQEQKKDLNFPSPTPTSSLSVGQNSPSPTTKNNDTIKDVTELQIQDIKLGTGDEAIAGKTVTVNYVGALTNRTKFDSSYDRGQPFTFKLGAGQVIAGWDQGVAGMKVGGKRGLIIPPSLGYGERGAGNVIPPNATLIFEIELLKVE